MNRKYNIVAAAVLGAFFAGQAVADEAALTEGLSNAKVFEANYDSASGGAKYKFAIGKDAWGHKVVRWELPSGEVVTDMQKSDSKPRMPW